MNPGSPVSPVSIDTIIFDLDGTLVDTELAAAQAIQGCFHSWNLAIDPTDAQYITGRTWEKAFEFMFGKYKLPVSPEEGAAQMLAAYRVALNTHLKIVPGAADAVRALSAHFPLALVSGSHRSEIFFCLEQLGVREHFQVILGAEDYPHSKPAPDGYLKALSQMNRSAERTLIFEDSTAGITSACAAGAWVVAITGTNHFGQDNSLAHFHIEDLCEVDASWVREFGNAVLSRIRRSSPINST
jgi:HAD superfamily hydrolase (TIGR01509 family)